MAYRELRSFETASNEGTLSGMLRPFKLPKFHVEAQNYSPKR